MKQMLASLSWSTSISVTTCKSQTLNKREYKWPFYKIIAWMDWRQTFDVAVKKLNFNQVLQCRTLFIMPLMKNPSLDLCSFHIHLHKTVNLKKWHSILQVRLLQAQYFHDCLQFYFLNRHHSYHYRKPIT